MRITFGQELRQEQRQILTQRMIQSMEILQLTLQQLEERIEQEVSENPVLEFAADINAESSGILLPQRETEEVDAGNNREDGGITGTGETPDAAGGSAMDSGIIEPEIRFEANADSADEFALMNEFEQNYSGVIGDESAKSQGYLDDIDSQNDDRLINIPVAGETFQSFLEEQLRWFEISEDIYNMAWRIINNLNAKGYFPYDLPDFLGSNHTPEELETAKKALATVQGLEPTGTAARDFQECLRLQIPADSPNAAVLRAIIHSFLEDVSQNRFTAIAKATGFAVERIQAAVGELKHFNPIPSAGFGSDTSAAVDPDVIVEISDDGGYTVRVTTERIPQLRISKLYSGLVHNPQTDKTTKDYIRKKVIAARWLIDAIEQRQSTLSRVADAIVRHQIDFFLLGPQAIRPLKMQQIADELSIHITTVSRACDDKWMLTPIGLFPLSRFFVTGLEATDGGEAVANDVVQIKIKAIIEAENKDNPLSDDAIVRILDADGVKIARRTIVKYRQIMHIPSSRGRRTYNR
ncbi:MAG: RNA polymerase factor sigma-54 [Planctomycetaceae bacterium]|nr:RNA polymerase factor sigma-54 [Planctomycetaceae bacterium]